MIAVAGATGFPEASAAPPPSAECRVGVSGAGARPAAILRLVH